MLTPPLSLPSLESLKPLLLDVAVYDATDDVSDGRRPSSVGVDGRAEPCFAAGHAGA